MIRAGDTIENPVTGERLVFRKTSRGDGRRGSRRSSASCSRTASWPPRTSIPHQDERFEVLTRRRVGFKLDGKRDRRAARRPDHRPGRHGATRFWNAGDDEAHFVCEVRAGAPVRAADRDDVRPRRRRQDEPEGDAEPAAARRDRAAPLRRRPAAVSAGVVAAHRAGSWARRSGGSSATGRRTFRHAPETPAAARQHRHETTPA